MKKSKVILAIALAVVLLITIMSAPTFSWFTRPKNQEGAQMVLGGDDGNYSIGAYNGESVTFSTKSSTTGVDGSYSTDANDDYACSGSIATYNRRYFCTTITNGSGTKQNVSLYARTLSIPTGANGTLALGVNGPTRSYRDYTALATATKTKTADSMRIYFQKPKNNPVDGWTGTEFYICWNEDSDTTVESLDSKGSNGIYYKMTYCGEKDGYYNYYADIPKTATHAFFAAENWGTNNNGEPNWAQRTQTLWDLGGDGQTQTQSKVYQLTSTVTNGNTTVYTPPYSVTGACINTYYDSLFAVKGNNLNAALQSGWSIGTLEYYSGDESIFKVNKTSGVITPVSAGTATLYTKSVGSSYGDSVQVETTVTVTDAANYVFNDVPIVKNIQMAAGEEVTVYWYVLNNSTSNTLTYKIDNLYLSL